VPPAATAADIVDKTRATVEATIGRFARSLFIIAQPQPTASNGTQQITQTTNDIEYCTQDWGGTDVISLSNRNSDIREIEVG
jgi:hypothetical protein